MADGAYAWWYLDALSPDGRQALVLIGFVGSVFSPYYAAARRRGVAPALSHCAINVCLYRDGRPLWAMTERGAAQVQRAPERLQVGGSHWHWDGQALEVLVDEWAVPWPRRLRGRVRVTPAWRQDRTWALDAAGHHHWWPVAPVAEVAVAFDAPAWRWTGRGYLDSNRGSEPLGAAFDAWHWARGHLPDGRCAVVYDTQPLTGPPRAMALHLGPDGAQAWGEGLAAVPLPRGRWGVAQQVRQDAGAPPPRRLLGLEDGPFYTRSVLGLQWQGQPVQAVQESLSLARFDRRWVQALLPFRMPRRAGAAGLRRGA